MEQEWQCDGLVGPTHNYAGLATGNFASAYNAGAPSNPREAALQGLKKMRAVRDLGIPQAVLPPHYRPALAHLKRLGFNGNLSEILNSAHRQAPGILASVFSSSFMWAANAATVSASRDSRDNKLHFAPATMVSHFHRALEAEATRNSLMRLFCGPRFVVHEPFQQALGLGDEGAANHMRIIDNKLNISKNIFVYGKGAVMLPHGMNSLPRQDLAASEAVMRLHGLDHHACMFLQQSPEAIAKGVFHNDVIAMNTGTVMIVHAQAFIPSHQQEIRALFKSHSHWKFREVTPDELSIEEAVRSYIFNSQLLLRPNGTVILVAPRECEQEKASAALIQKLLNEQVIDSVLYLDVRESMRNGGGPACLRLRVPMTPEEASAIHSGIVLTDDLYDKLEKVIKSYYRDHLAFDNFCDPQFVKELDITYERLATAFGIPDFYHDDRCRHADA